MIKLFPVLKSDDEPNIFMVSKEKTHSLTKWVIYYITFSESRYKHSISSWDNPVACEITSIATPNFLIYEHFLFFLLHDLLHDL